MGLSHMARHVGSWATRMSERERRGGKGRLSGFWELRTAGQPVPSQPGQRSSRGITIDLQMSVTPGRDHSSCGKVNEASQHPNPARAALPLFCGAGRLQESWRSVWPRSGEKDNASPACHRL